MNYAVQARIKSEGAWSDWQTAISPGPKRRAELWLNRFQQDQAPDMEYRVVEVDTDG